MKSPPQTTLELFNGNEALAIKYVEKCKQEMPVQLQKMKTAINDKAMTDLSDLAHSFKGQFSYLGADHLVALSAKLEQAGQSDDSHSCKAIATELIQGINQLLNEL